MKNDDKENKMLLAFHGKKTLKAKTVKAMQADIDQERLQPGHYWDGKTGCFVGCVIRGKDHSKFETVLGIPQKLARIADGIFEGLPTQAARQQFAMDYLNAPAVDADLNQVADRFLHWLLVDKKNGVINFAKTDRSKKAIKDVAALYARTIKGEKITIDDWREVRAAAASPAHATFASAAAASAAAYATFAAAYAASAAAYAAEAAAYAAAAATYDVAAADAARSKARTRQAEKLLELLKEAPVIKKAA